MGRESVEAWLVQNLHTGLASWKPRRANGADEVQRHFAGEFSLAWGGLCFCSIPFIDWMRPTHPVEGNLLSPELTN